MCMCVWGRGGRSEHWRAGRIGTDWIWPHTAVFRSVTLLTLVRFGVCVCMSGVGWGGGGRLMMICNNDLRFMVCMMMIIAVNCITFQKLIMKYDHYCFFHL